ncbi:hypothetical protein PHLCEN_2v11132 [Hermanssonia centrifuga]|uniref:G-alpha-domain-containing protein n=1 Tax=Hermanssonia centrifuga TaxID=98765 RepID=A0A2R6NLA2_9APHY|nr:hypothetical protein PHLCEN_2v11132 [Hermanssonia centrifuga]
MGRAVDEDPLALAIAPPPGETEEEKAERLKAEEAARLVSEKIDEEIREERAALRRKKKPIKVLLLGQSESDFQLSYAQQAWSEERVSWRTVIQLNLLRNVNTILDVLAQEMSTSPANNDSSDEDEPDITLVPATSSARPPIRFTEKQRVLKLRLAPLRSVQEDLQARLGASDWPTPKSGTTDSAKAHSQDFFVWSNASWKAALRPGRRSLDTARAEKGQSRRRNSEENETAEVLASCADDMKALWKDETIQEMLKRRKLRLDLMPGFFLQEGDVDRIARRDYLPSDDDVVRARLRTLGVQEHRIHFETGPATGTEWYIYDVGGSRTQRPTWFPYFDDCNAIIFLAPISCFDEKLAEDRRVNRLEDSYSLWKMICSSKLLSHAQIILFLNKCDLLEKKLLGGVRVKDYVPSFGERSNDAKTAAQFTLLHVCTWDPFSIDITQIM